MRALHSSDFYECILAMPYASVGIFTHTSFSPVTEWIFRNWSGPFCGLSAPLPFWLDIFYASHHVDAYDRPHRKAVEKTAAREINAVHIRMCLVISQMQGNYYCTNYCTKWCIVHFSRICSYIQNDRCLGWKQLQIFRMLKKLVWLHFTPTRLPLVKKWYAEFGTICACSFPLTDQTSFVIYS